MPVFETSREPSADRQRVNAGARACPRWIDGRHRPTRGYYACAESMHSPRLPRSSLSVLRTQCRCLQRQRLSPSKLCLGDFGPVFAEHLKTSKTAIVECSHIGRIAVIKLLKNVMHH